jgi:hypothetical protein
MAAKLDRVSNSKPGRRLPRMLRTATAVALLAVATLATAAVELRADHPDTYVVQRGDTLWSIAARFLQRPWLWPEIWQANPQINNPHAIYPGDVISLAYLDQPAIKLEPGPRDEPPIDAIPLAEIEPFLKDLRVVDGFENLPHVVGLEEDRLRGGQGQLAYLRGVAAQPGDRVMVVRPTRRYTRLDRSAACCDLFRDDDLDFRGRHVLDTQDFWTDAVLPDNGNELLGYELMRVASGTITRGEVGGIEASTLLIDPDSKEVRVGDRILPVEPQAYDLQFFPHPPARQFEYGRARVMAVADMITTGGPHDVVALSVGAREGVDNGTVFSTWRVGSNTVDEVEYGNERTKDSVPSGSKVRLPDEFAGHVMVFRTFEKVSYAIVLDSVRPTRVGHELKHPDAAY